MVCQHKKSSGITSAVGRRRCSIWFGHRCIRGAQCGTQLFGGNQAALIKFPQPYNRGVTLLKDGVTGDCLTTLRVIQLPYYQAIQNQPVESHQIIAEACRSTKIYEITKVKDFNQCQSDPLQLSMHPIISPLPLYNYHFNDTLQVK